jgi:zinc and cadmium transporter
MTVLGWILLATALSGLASAGLAGAFLLLPAPARQRLLPHLVSFATGALLGAALLALVPHAIEGAGFGAAHDVGLALLCGLLVFFVLEKFVLWRHCHGDEADPHVHHGDDRSRSAAWLVLAGDGLHNFLDGVLIAAAFLTDVHLGIVTAIAVAAHEIPQEIGDFAILLNAGFDRAHAFALNVATSLTSVAGGLIAWFALSRLQPWLPYALAVAAASFLYVAVADLIPGLHRRFDLRTSAGQVALIALGIAVVAIAENAAHAH